jgi:hypothetical protein
MDVDVLGASSMSAPPDPWWARRDEAADLLASLVNAEVAKAAGLGTYVPPPGAPTPRRARRPASLRHLAEAIRTHRLAPGVAIDKDVVAAVLAGDPRWCAEPIAVVPVVRAARLLAGRSFDEADRRRLTVACDHVADLAEAARAADEASPGLLPVRSGPLRPGGPDAGPGPSPFPGRGPLAGWSASRSWLSPHRAGRD